MAKELDWKSSKAATPRGFESHVLRQQTEVRNHFRFSFLLKFQAFLKLGEMQSSGPFPAKNDYNFHC